MAPVHAPAGESAHRRRCAPVTRAPPFTSAGRRATTPQVVVREAQHAFVVGLASTCHRPHLTGMAFVMARCSLWPSMRSCFVRSRRSAIGHRVRIRTAVVLARSLW